MAPKSPELKAPVLARGSSYKSKSDSESSAAAKERTVQSVAGECITATTTVTVQTETEGTVEEGVRERLKRHRVEVAGRVWIPENWGQERFLKDWVDCSAFDAALSGGGIVSARAALVEDCRRANSGGFRIENSCG